MSLAEVQTRTAGDRGADRAAAQRRSARGRRRRSGLGRPCRRCGLVVRRLRRGPRRGPAVRQRRRRGARRPRRRGTAGFLGRPGADGARHRAGAPRRALRLGRRGPVRLRLLRPGAVRLRPARRRPAAGLPGPGPGRPRGRPAPTPPPGDLVFYGSPVDHVGIYAGDGRMVVAPHTGAVVREQSVDLTPGHPRPPGPPRARPARRPDLRERCRRGPRPPAGASTLPAAARRTSDQIESAAAQRRGGPALVAAVAWTRVRLQPARRPPRSARRADADHAGHRPRPRGGPARPRPGPAAAAPATSPSSCARFGGRTDLALAAYNAGPGAVAQVRRRPALRRDPGVRPPRPRPHEHAWEAPREPRDARRPRPPAAPSRPGPRGPPGLLRRDGPGPRRPGRADAAPWADPSPGHARHRAAPADRHRHRGRRAAADRDRATSTPAAATATDAPAEDGATDDVVALPLAVVSPTTPPLPVAAVPTAAVADLCCPGGSRPGCRVGRRACAGRVDAPAPAAGRPDRAAGAAHRGRPGRRRRPGAAHRRPPVDAQHRRPRPRPGRPGRPGERAGDRPEPGGGHLRAGRPERAGGRLPAKRRRRHRDGPRPGRPGSPRPGRPTGGRGGRPTGGRGVRRPDAAATDPGHHGARAPAGVSRHGARHDAARSSPDPGGPARPGGPGREQLRAAGGGGHRLVIRLDPPELGRLTLTITSRGGEVDVAMIVERGGAGQALGDQRQSLGQALRDAGFDLQASTCATAVRTAGGLPGEQRGRDAPARRSHRPRFPPTG